METLINLIIFSLLISNFAKCDGSKVDVSRVLDELKDIVGQLETDSRKKTAEKKDFTAINDAEHLDELDFEAEIKKILQNAKSEKDGVKNNDGMELSDQLTLDAELERMLQNDKAENKEDVSKKYGMELSDELKLDAELERMLQDGNAENREGVSNNDGMELSDHFKHDAELEKMFQNDNTANAYCKDHPYQKRKCPTYKKASYCETRKSQMGYWCPKTCGFCKSSCKNFKTDCLKKYLEKGCMDKDVRRDCPRTCLECCADIDSRLCKSLRKYCHVKGFNKKRLRHLCPKTCGYCGKGLAPPPCLSTTYGCCWDKSTPASAPIGSGRENCPRCKDKKSPLLCYRFHGFCTDFNPDHIIGRDIRSLCPRTCGVCGPHAVCKDHPFQEESCPRYKRQGNCKSNENRMRYYCSKTCGFCKPKACVDRPPRKGSCHSYKKIGGCKKYIKHMRLWCPRTCGFCK